MKKFRASFALWILMLLCSLIGRSIIIVDQTTALSSWETIDIGTLGGNYSQPRDMNNSGEVVGHSSVVTNGASYGFYWNPETEIMERLITSDGRNFWAEAINNSGYIAGFTISNGSNVAAVWEISTGSMMILGLPTSFSAIASDINDQGTVVGVYTIRQGNTYTNYTYAWDLQTSTYNSIQTNLGAASLNENQLLGGDGVIWDIDANFSERFLTDCNNRTVSSLNDNNIVTGSCVNQGWKYDYATNTYLDLPIIPGGVGAIPRDINNAGYIVGDSLRFSTPDRSIGAVLYPDSTDWELIPTGTANSAWPVAINDSNWIVGMKLYNGSGIATLWKFMPATEPQTFTLTPSADTYLRSGQSNRNHGADTEMQIQSSGNNRGLVRFDQSAIASAVGSGTITSAKLRLTITDNGNNWGTGRTIDLHRLIKDWAEGNGTANNRGTGPGATWDCAIDSIIENQSKNCSGITEWEMGQPNNPLVHPWIETPSATQTIINNQTGVIEFDVTADLVGFINGTDNFGWIIKKTNEGQNGRVNFGTRETLYVPELVITYQP